MSRDQVSTNAKSKEAQTPAKAPPEANGNAAVEAHGTGLQNVPEVATLLDFVAWVVLAEVPASARSANWFKGRGGYLADQLDAVCEASIRAQVTGHWLHRHTPAASIPVQISCPVQG